jgi:hypothetical protein
VLKTSPISCAESLEILEASCSPNGVSGFVQGSRYIFNLSILLSHDLFISEFVTKPFSVSVLFPIRATCPANSNFHCGNQTPLSPPSHYCLRTNYYFNLLSFFQNSQSMFSQTESTAQKYMKNYSCLHFIVYILYRKREYKIY